MEFEGTVLEMAAYKGNLNIVEALLTEEFIDLSVRIRGQKKNWYL